MIFPEPETLNLLAAVLHVFSFGILLHTPAQLGRQDHDQLAAIPSWWRFHLGDFGKLGRDQLELAFAHLGVSQLTRPEKADYPDLVAFLEEPLGIPDDDLQVVVGRVRAELDALDVLNPLLAFLLPLVLLVFVFAVIRDPAYGGIRVFRNQDQVQILVAGSLDSLP